MKTYVVFVGRVEGIFEAWDECKQMTNGFSCAKFKSYETYDEAIEAWEAWEHNGELPTSLQ